MRKAAHVGELLDQLIRNLGLDERLQQTRALVIWDAVVGPQIAAHTKPNKIRDDVLEVCVDQPTWMQQLQLMKPQILKKLNGELGEVPLKDIYWKRGKVTARQTEARPAPLPWKTVQVDSSEKLAVSRLLTRIDDAELRRGLESFLLKQTRMNKARDDL